jgi:phage shock protein A
MAYKIARSELVASSLREEVKLDLSQLKAKIGEIERQLDTVKTIKTNMKGAVTSIGKADDGLREIEASIREIAGEILLMIKTGDRS